MYRDNSTTCIQIDIPMEFYRAMKARAERENVNAFTIASRIMLKAIKDYNAIEKW